jgi:exonuclease V gamma subunit
MEPAADRTVTIHRCHTFSRQAEVLHDALLHAFHELPNLQPDEVLIVSPSIATAAPHLLATFDRTVTVPVAGPGGSPARSLAFSLRRRADHTTPTPA